MKLTKKDLEKDMVMTCTGWQLFKARWLGEKRVERSGQYVLEAFLYKDKWYLSQYCATFLYSPFWIFRP